MITVKEYTVKMPSYALSYLVNGDSSALNEEDIAIIDRWYNKLQARADLFQCVVIIAPGDEEPYFTATPEFGLPCDVVDCTITFLN